MRMRSLIFISFLVWGTLLAKEARPIEQTLDGFILGKSTLQDAEHKYPGKATRQSAGKLTLLTIKPAGACELSFVQESDRAAITTATLSAQPSASISSSCRTIHTGAGLRLGDSMQKAEKLYGKPQAVRQEAKGSTLSYHDQSNQCAGKTSENVVRSYSLTIWANEAGRIHEFSMSVVWLTCAELRDTVVVP